MEMNRYASPFQIGNVTIPNRTVFAPMAGVSDLPFRLLCHEQGAGLVCMEMISATQDGRALGDFPGGETCIAADLRPRA